MGTYVIIKKPTLIEQDTKSNAIVTLTQMVASAV